MERNFKFITYINLSCAAFFIILALLLQIMSYTSFSDSGELPIFKYTKYSYTPKISDEFLTFWYYFSLSVLIINVIFLVYFIFQKLSEPIYYLPVLAFVVYFFLVPVNQWNYYTKTYFKIDVVFFFLFMISLYSIATDQHKPSNNIINIFYILTSLLFSVLLILGDLFLYFNLNYGSILIFLFVPAVIGLIWGLKLLTGEQLKPDRMLLIAGIILNVIIVALSLVVFTIFFSSFWMLTRLMT